VTTSPTRTADHPQARVFGVAFSTGSMQAALTAIAGYVARPAQPPAFCCFVNAHCLNLAFRDRAYARLLNQADQVWADGVGVAIAARNRRTPVLENVNGTDMLPLLCQSGHSLYLLGGKPGVAEAAREKLQAQYPELRILGTWHGYFPDDCTALIQDINAKAPDVLMVAMGVPKQEFWIAEHRGQLNCRVCLAVGGLLDFASGRIPRAPHWLRRLRGEWLFRLWQEPRRMFKRYILGNPLFLWRVWRYPENRNWEQD